MSTVRRLTASTRALPVSPREKEEGKRLHYPGTGNLIAQPTDTALLAEAMDWAINTPAAANQIYNVTNGEVVAMRDIWPVIADCVGMEPGELRPISFDEELSGRSKDWDRVAQKYGLVGGGLDSFVGQSFQLADFSFTLSEPNAAPPCLLSTVKIRKAGFSSYLASDEMYRKWFRRYQRNGLLPPP